MEQSDASLEKDFAILGLVSAEASKWLSLSLYDDNKVKKYANTFLDFDPYNPTVDQLYALLTSLFEVGNKFKLQLIEETEEQ